MFFNKRKDETKRWQPEDDVAITDVSVVDGDLHVVGVYKGKVHRTEVHAYSLSDDPEADLSEHVAHAKRQIVNDHRYQEWQRGMQKAVSSYPVAGR